MKTWHIAALVIVGLIVAGIAYTMYEKKKGGRLLRLPGPLPKAQMKSEGTQQENSNVPGLGNKVEPERPAAFDGTYGHYKGQLVYGPTRQTRDLAIAEREERKRDGDFWDAFQNWL
jgi:hypothetical protein